MTVIVIGTYNRGHLLWRSLLAYSNHNVTIIVIDDDSNDNTENICKLWPNVDYIKLPPKNGEWRDSSSFLNMGIKKALNEYKADNIFVTHPEIIVGATTIESSVNLATDKETWISCKGYYLTPGQQNKLDKVRWKKDLLEVRKLPDFYGTQSAEFTGNKDYLPESIDKIPLWHSWIFGGGRREMWQYFGGLTEFKQWGSVDVDLLNRRAAIGMNTITPGLDTDIVVHQNHDDPKVNILTPRDMFKCLDKLPYYPTKEHALKPELLK